MRRADLETGLCACLALLLPEDLPRDEEEARWLARRFPGRAWIAVELVRGGADRARLRRLERMGHGIGLPLCAAGDVHMHDRERRPLQDTLTAIRLGTPLEAAGHALYPNGERHLRDRETLSRLYPESLERDPRDRTDIVRFARAQGILCQGRGCLGITEVDPARIEVLFERFISRERHEPPDIDVDFEHERRGFGEYGAVSVPLLLVVLARRLRARGSWQGDLVMVAVMTASVFIALGHTRLLWSQDRFDRPRLAEAMGSGAGPDTPFLSSGSTRMCSSTTPAGTFIGRRP